MPQFVHLHVHTQYSILDGQASVQRLVDKAMADGQPGIAVTDHGDMFGIKEFYNYVQKVKGKCKDKAAEAEARIAALRDGTETCADPAAEIAKCERQLEECRRKLAFKPIIGCEVYVARRRLHDKEGKPDQSGYHLILLAKNLKGYHNLIKIVSKAWTEGFYMRPRTDRTEIEKYHEGLICCSACLAGEVPRAITANDLEKAEESIRWHKKVFGDDYYLELQLHKATVERANHEAYPMQLHVNKHLRELAAKHNVRMVCTNDVHFVDEDNAEAHDRLICLSTGKDLDDPKRMLYSKQEWLKTTAEMAAIFGQTDPEAMSTTVDICNQIECYSIDHAPIMPNFEIPEEFGTEAEYRARLTEKDLFDEFTRDENGNVVMSEEEGLKKIQKLGGYDKLYRIKFEADYLAKLTMDGAHRRYGEQLTEEQEERLKFELHIMKTMGFPGYFLIVQDFINWSKTHGVPVGPGRGSGAGSLVAYSLGITDLDPLHFDLLFERFLNPERVSMPDFDVDFCQYNRDRTIDYVKRTYGVDAVSQIATFGTLGAKAVVRDVGRALDVPYMKTDALAKLIPMQPGRNISLDDAIAEVPEFKEAIERDDEYKEIIRLAKPLEGLTRNLGMHAGGVLIAPGKLTDFCPLYNSDGRPENTISQFDKKDVENVGLVKFDFLGLTTLSILAKAVEIIDKLYPEQHFELERIPVDDAATYELFQQANTAAVFQFESDGMRGLLKQARPDRLEDLVALNALYRPGPMDLIPSYIDRKFGREKVEYLDDRMEPVLKETYGIMVYQEQVMRVAQVVGGYSLGGADLLRRAMGKKNVEEMKRQRAVFIKGAGERGVKESVATEIFDLMEKFAGYGFNKSHAAAYSYVAYQTAYLKVHHTAAFFAANLCMVMDDGDKMKALIDDARANGVDFRLPDVNVSEWFFSVPTENVIQLGLGAIKGINRALVEAIVSEREANGPFEDIFDFAARVEGVNYRIFESMVRAGAFDSTDADRGRLFSNISNALQGGAAVRQSAGQDSLFGGEETKKIVNWVEGEQWSFRRNLEEEMTAFGFSLSGHFFDEYKDDLRAIGCMPLDELQVSKENVCVGGVISSIRQINGKRGVMGVVGIDDGTHSIEFFAFSDLWATLKTWIAPKMAVWVKGRPKYDDFSKKVTIYPEEIMSADDAVFARLKAISICVDSVDALKTYSFLQQRPSNAEGYAPVINITVRAADLSGNVQIYSSVEAIKKLMKTVKHKSVEYV